MRCRETQCSLFPIYGRCPQLTVMECSKWTRREQYANIEEEKIAQTPLVAHLQSHARPRAVIRPPDADTYRLRSSRPEEPGHIHSRRPGGRALRWQRGTLAGGCRRSH